ncbi:hypothetical protein F5Y00DRAFT_258244 [Daldinia vernicosa]|uniref:uncharacterized protein n=1 Tax=Daldinia vernicosa TaxID=114800 RepID=UPI002007F9DE|nr:uncharacterized protein F5Y00DRAFT_258244 [Daldinia vernicosa]KAI0852987.1 hypothetical protein F5Y00DRAFT_258244 [Daldinia vernicosa]
MSTMPITEQHGPDPPSPCLDVVDTSPARVDLAVSALENPPVRPRVTQITGPLDKRAVRLQHLERVRAVASHGHFLKV